MGTGELRTGNRSGGEGGFWMELKILRDGMELKILKDEQILRDDEVCFEKGVI